MAEGKYDNNGYNSGDFKRNKADAGQGENDMDQDGEDGAKLNEKAGEYMRELLSEKIKLNTQKFPMSLKLIDQEVQKVQTTGRIPARDNKYLDVFHEKPVKVAVKVLVPVKEHPKFNFVGKLIGPKGNTMKQMQEDTMCKMAVLGRGSMRDRQKEEELRKSLDPKYAHLSDELHVEISALAPPAEAHARIAYALAEVKKYLIPDNNDMMRQNQMRDMMDRAGPPRPPPGRAPPRMPPPQPPMQRQMPPKNKVISILDRARSAMDSSYGYEDPYPPMPEPPVRGGGGPRAASQDFYYDRNDRYYEEEPSYYKEEPREFKPSSAREVGTRRPQQPQRHYARHSPYGRPPK
ncbi:unnamed protein product [Chilo suppressalis]|uniref:K Homology domain-containing protein n=1 Tax=Chilo suppressalis TaxID=168631 RepID=A0ABN8B762_CHISP|nr:hypothetical protein evm_004554 [Chilo suppressalis]CAH0403191.1 unnamed protein product [Chilo suppressalis]